MNQPLRLPVTESFFTYLPLLFKKSVFLDDPYEFLSLAAKSKVVRMNTVHRTVLAVRTSKQVLAIYEIKIFVTLAFGSLVGLKNYFSALDVFLLALNVVGADVEIVL